MGKNRKYKPLDENYHIGLILQITALYYACLLGLIYLTIEYNVPLYEGELSKIPTNWLQMIIVIYYIVPMLLAVLFGFIFKPFWRNARNLLTPILVIQMLYSLVLFAFRYEYILLEKNAVHLSKLGHLKVLNVENRYIDENKNGLIERIVVLMTIDATEFPLGSYFIYSEISQKDQLLPKSIIGYHYFSFIEDSLKIFRVRFNLNPQLYESFFERGNFEINVGIKRRIKILAEAKKIISFARWAPYFRFTSWDGKDIDIKEEQVDLDYVTKVYSFSLLPLKLPQYPVLFVDYIEDYGYDTDNDGSFDQLVVTFEVESKYEGPIYIQGIVKGASYPVSYENYLEYGINRVEYVIDSKDIYNFNLDGPYEIIDFQLTNDSPACQEDEKNCPVRIKETFVLHMDNYLTNIYTMDEFDDNLLVP